MKPKGRPKKTRYIKGEPHIRQFSPRGRPGRPDEVDLTIDQYEAIRLADFQQMTHAQACKFMKVSRQTFGRILKEARKKLSEGLILGKIIRFEGGKFKVG